MKTNKGDRRLINFSLVFLSNTEMTYGFTRRITFPSVREVILIDSEMTYGFTHNIIRSRVSLSVRPSVFVRLYDLHSSMLCFVDHAQM